MISRENVHPTLKPAYRSATLDRLGQTPLPESQFMPAYTNQPSTSTTTNGAELPLASPEESDLDSSSAITAREVTVDGSNRAPSVETVLPAAAATTENPTSLSITAGLTADDPITACSSTTLNCVATPSMSSLVLRSRAASLGRRSTFPRVLDVYGGSRSVASTAGQSSRAYRVTMLDGQVHEFSLKVSNLVLYPVIALSSLPYPMDYEC